MFTASPLDSDNLIPLTAPVQEIFSSFQGEGPYVGKRQVFIRFEFCHLQCVYCDTPKRVSNGLCQVELQPGTGAFKTLENPLTPEQVLEEVLALTQKTSHHSISLTGGEPLLQADFLVQLLPMLQAHGLRTYLETSASQPRLFQKVLPWVDIISMDIKLPSATLDKPLFKAHESFYRLIQEHHKEHYIKLVFGPETTEEEIAWVKSIVSDRAVPLVLQPVTDLDDGWVHVPPAAMFALQEQLAQSFTDVRLIPQTHKMLQVL